MLLTLSACFVLSQTPASPLAQVWPNGPASTANASLSWLESAERVHITFGTTTMVGRERAHAELRHIGNFYSGFAFLSVERFGGEELVDVIKVEIPEAALKPLLMVMAERPTAKHGSRGNDGTGADASWFSMDAIDARHRDADRGEFPGPQVHLELPPSSQPVPAAFIINEFGALAIDPAAVKAARKPLMPLLGRKALDALWLSTKARTRR